MRALYICYFGINENLVQTQVLPYLKELARHGHEMHLVTFEPRYSSSWTREAISNLRQQLESKGISWTPLAYHKSPTLPATLFDICAGLLFIWRLNRQRPLDILHARSHIPMIMALLARYLTGSAVIFDIRGLIADEYVDAGVWQPASPVYRGMKYFEALGIRRADRLIVLTKRMKDFIIDHYHRPEGQISVIPCCIDPQRFIAQTVGASALSTFEIVYAGSVTGLYLLEEMGRFFLAVLDLVPKATLRILTSTPPEEATAKLCRLGIDPSRFNIQSVSPDQVPGILARAKAGISFRKPTFSQIAASPTKIPEYLMAGLPVISNAGIGDTDAILEAESVGVVIHDLTREGYAQAARQLLELLESDGLSQRCRNVARRVFDLNNIGGARYAEVYRQLGLAHGDE